MYPCETADVNDEDAARTTTTQSENEVMEIICCPTEKESFMQIEVVQQGDDAELFESGTFPLDPLYKFGLNCIYNGTQLEATMEILFKEKPSPDNVDQPAESQSVPQHNGETVPEISNTDASIQLEATMEILFKETIIPDSMDQPAESQVDPQHIEEAVLETDVPATQQKESLQPDSSDCPEVLQSYVALF